MSLARETNPTTTPSQNIPRKKRRPGLLLFQLFLVIGLLLMLWFSFGQNVLAPLKQGSAPQRLGALSLVNSVEGTEALTQINKLHGTDITLVSAYIAHYARSNERATVWVGTAADSVVAASLLRQMVAGITNGNAGFSNLRQLSITKGYHSHEVFQVDGAGGQHFFFQSKLVRERVVWLTVEAGEAMPILEQAITTF